MNLSKLYGKNINPSCGYCLYCVDNGAENGTIVCEKGRNPEECSSCGSFRYEPTMREPKTQPLLAEFSPDDFKI